MNAFSSADNFTRAEQPSPTAAPAPPTRPRARFKKPVYAALALSALCGSGVYAHHWWTIGRYTVSTDDAYVGGDVTVLATKVPGFIANVAVVDNQAVRAGDLVVKLDDRDFRTALNRADAVVAAQRASLANLDATRRLQESIVDQAAADIASVTAESARARFDFDRYRQLSAVDFASQQRFQQADADYQKAVAAEKKARATLNSAERQIDVIETQKMQVKAALDQASADLDIAKLNLGYTEIRAPFDGVIGNRSARAGGYATVGAALASLAPAQGLWVDANFKESQLAGMRPGQRVTIFADALPDETIIGHVVSLAPATGAQFSVLPPENATGNFTKIVQRVPVRIQLEGDASVLGKLRPGLSVTAEVDQRDAREEAKSNPLALRRTEREFSR